jgi:hypothetical protein
MKKAHIGARVTFESNILHLISTGLVQVRQIVGEHEGNEYTVLLPEESMPSQTSQSRYAQKVDRLDSLQSSLTRHTLSSTSTTVSDVSKTSFKTKEEKTDDDAVLALLYDKLQVSSTELTGKPINPEIASVGEKWPTFLSQN